MMAAAKEGALLQAATRQTGKLMSRDLGGCTQGARRLAAAVAGPDPRAAFPPVFKAFQAFKVVCGGWTRCLHCQRLCHHRPAELAGAKVRCDGSCDRR